MSETDIYKKALKRMRNIKLAIVFIVLASIYATTMVVLPVLTIAFTIGVAVLVAIVGFISLCDHMEYIADASNDSLKQYYIDQYPITAKLMQLIGK